MALERELQKLGKLKIGNIERIVGEITDSEYNSRGDNKKIISKRIKDFADYSEMIKIKLPKIIGNIGVMAGVILKLDETGNYNNYEIDGNYCFNIYKKTKKRSIFAKKQEDLEITIYRSNEMEIRIGFDKKEIINDMTLKIYGHYYAIGTNAIEFTESYLWHIEEKIEAGRNEILREIYSVPEILNKIPDAIAKGYKERLRERINKKRRINSQLGDNKRIINSLDCSDF